MQNIFCFKNIWNGSCELDLQMLLLLDPGKVYTATAGLGA